LLRAATHRSPSLACNSCDRISGSSFLNAHIRQQTADAPSLYQHRPKRPASASGPSSDDTQLAPRLSLTLTARMTRIWNRSDCPACKVEAGFDGSISSRPRAPAVSEPCRRHQPDMARQHLTTSDPIRKTNRASAWSAIRRPGSTPMTGRQARPHRETMRPVEALEITTNSTLDVRAGGMR
jgi:hypothetical protein